MSMKDEDRRIPSRQGDKAKPAGRLVELMFSGMSHPGTAFTPRARRAPEEPYHPLRQFKAAAGASFHVLPPRPLADVRPDSPAIDVMTDLSKIAAVTIPSIATIDEANQTMIAHRVRALFVVDEERAVLGIVTSTDLLGEKPIQLAQERGMRHDEVLVRDVMTPADRLEAMEFDDVLTARVGDVVATLRLSGRQHALVIEGVAGAPLNVRGIFSLTRIARQLGLPPQPVHDIGRTFIEIEAAIGG
jgi:CBS domain-containing protein